MENHSYGQVIGTKAAPYQTSLAEQCGTLTDWATVGSPSLPNYIGAAAGNTFGIADDNSPSAHPLTADNLFRQVRAAGKTERSYQEDMPGPCSTGTTRLYAVKHNPAAYFTDPADRQACLADDVPLGTPTAGALAADLANGTLPAFALITPNLCNDTHDCSVATGDAWLRSWIPKLVATPSYQAGDTAIVLTYDEYSPVPNAILAASVPPKTRVTAHVDHYALLRATEELLGLNGLLGQAASAPDLRPLLNL
jgi:phospholipase C